MVRLIIGFIPLTERYRVPVWTLAIVFGLIGLRKQYKRETSIAGLILGLLGAAHKIGFWIIASGGLIVALYGSIDNNLKSQRNDAYSKFVNTVNSINEHIFSIKIYK